MTKIDNLMHTSVLNNLSINQNNYQNILIRNIQLISYSILICNADFLK